MIIRNYGGYDKSSADYGVRSSHQGPVGHKQPSLRNEDKVSLAPSSIGLFKLDGDALPEERLKTPVKSSSAHKSSTNLPMIKNPHSNGKHLVSNFDHKLKKIGGLNKSPGLKVFKPQEKKKYGFVTPSKPMSQNTPPPNVISSISSLDIFDSIGFHTAGGRSEGRAKTNQDSLFVDTNMLNNPLMSLFAVFDGHGLHGHRVSQLLISNLKGRQL